MEDRGDQLDLAAHERLGLGRHDGLDLGHGVRAADVDPVERGDDLVAFKRDGPLELVERVFELHLVEPGVGLREVEQVVQLDRIQPRLTVVMDAGQST